ncbi:MAG: GAF domain-containing protein [Chloroflexi bacterium]|nr:GAF domain-containing protein [Chloroflexota bacterium]
MKRILKEIVSRAASPGLVEMRTIIVVVLATVFIATTTLAFLEINRPEMLVLSGVFLLAAIVSYRGYHSAGSWFALLASLTILSLFVFRNNGIRDIAMMGLIVVLVAAGLLAGKAGTTVIGTIIILEIGVFSALEAQGLIVNQFSAQNYFADYFSLSIAIALITILQWLIINRLNNTILNSEKELKDRQAAEEQLMMRLAELQAMHGVSEALVQQTDLQKLIHETGEQIRLTFKAENLTIGIHDPNTNMIHFPYDFQDNAHRRDEPIRYGEGITSKIMEMKKPLIINEDWVNMTQKMGAIYMSKVPAKSSVFVPIMTDERVIGVVGLDNAEREFAFTDNDVRLLSTIAANLAVAIEKTRLQESLKRELEMREKLIRELEIKNEELERFTYTASHDLKSPLITIRGFLGYLEKDFRAGDTDRLQSDIRRISDATEKMHRLLTELLELSRVGRIVNEKQDVPFGNIVAEALRRVEGQRKQKQVSVRVGSDFPIVHVDKERMIEVVQNLVDNAVKFMGDQAEPQVEINHATKDGRVVFYVRDNGMGIRKEFQERIFGLFDKLSPDSEGTGVGLALVKRIIEVHGGEIWVESEEGRGSTFYFTLA